MDGVRPSSAAAPSIWYADVATPQLNDGGSSTVGSSSPEACVAKGFMVLLGMMAQPTGCWTGCSQQATVRTAPSAVSGLPSTGMLSVHGSKAFGHRGWNE